MSEAGAPPMDWQSASQNILGAADKQNQNNRLNTSNPFASQTFNADGSTSSQFSGGLGLAATGLQQQAAGMSQPMDWSQFGTVGSGDQARQQAVNASYNQSTSRLDPQWDQRMAQERTRLINQGLDPNSEAATNDMNQLGMQRNDAYGSAMNNAQMMGQSAGDSVFRNNLASQQNAIANALRQRGQPLAEMQQMQGLLGQPGYNQDSTTLAGRMGAFNAMQAGNEDDWKRAGVMNAGAAGTAQGAMSGLGAIAGIAGLAL